MEKYYKTFYQKLTLITSLACVVLFFLVAVEEQFLREWKAFQMQFKNILLAEAQTDLERDIANNFKVEIKQVMLDDFGAIDRCVSCHNGIDNPNMKDKAIPHAAHSGDYIKDHPVEKYGCTVCHGGQDRALTTRGAFATEKGVHWEYPVIPLENMQSSCGKCHMSVFDKDQTLYGAEKLIKGRELFLESGCLGCHKVRGVGGTTGLELTNVGAKTKHEYSFEHVEGEHTVMNWLKEHFRNPQIVSPASVMPKVELNDDDLEHLVTFTMSLYDPKYPVEYYGMENIAEFKGGRKTFDPQEAFTVLCSNCHGTNGEGIVHRQFERIVPALNNQDFLASASEGFIRETIKGGRNDVYMSAWSHDKGGLSDDEINSLVNLIKSWQETPPTFSEVRSARKSVQFGGELFLSRCGTCHGANGEGGIGPVLNTQDLLSLASDEFLYKTIAHGRRNTAMVSWSTLSAVEMSSIIAFIRSWQEVPQVRLSNRRISGDVTEGEQLYAGMCVGCHGTNGQGGVGTALFNKDFLDAASDEFIYYSMSRGRSQSAMRSWAKELQGIEQLTDKEMSDIVAYIRSKENETPDRIYNNITPGTPSKGLVLYAGMCAGCHGANGEGKHGPVLNDQNFLSAATNGFLQATIANGRRGTVMKSWAKGAQGYEELTTDEINDIVAYIRTWQKPVTSNK